MTKVVKCSSIIPGCQFVAHGDDDAEVLVKMSQHAQATHGVDHLSPELKAKLKDNIEEE